MTIYENNLHALESRYPELCALLDGPIPSDHIRVLSTPSGPTKVVVCGESGEDVMLQNTVEPLGDAQGTAVHQARTLKGVTVILGLELGGMVKALVPFLDECSRVVVYEADPALFRTALQLDDLTEVFASARVKILVGPDVRLADACGQWLVDIGGPLRVVSSEASMTLAPSVYGQKARQDLARLQTIILATQQAIGQRGAQFIESILENVPHIVSCSGVRVLKGLFPDRPALLVAAGPSLEKNVHNLARAKGHAVMICADTALGYLLAHGITPDFVVSVDPQEATYRKFEGVNIPERVALVFHPAAHHQIVKHFPGPKFVMDSTIPAYQWLKKFLPDKGPLETETMCQIHVGFNLVEWLGCRAIILVGQDLCYTENRMHAKGSSYLGEEDERRQVAKGQETKDLFGCSVKTDPTFLNYKAILEKKIAKFPGPVVNATEGGLPIDGAEVCRLVDALADLLPDTPVDIGSVTTTLGQDATPIDMRALLREVRAGIRDLRRVGRTSRHVCRLLERMAEKRETSRVVDEELITLGNHVERLTGLIPRYQTARTLLHWMDINIERRLKEDTTALDRLRDQDARHDRQIELGLRYYGSLGWTAPVLQQMCIRLFSRLTGIREVEDAQEETMIGLGLPSSAERYGALEVWDRAATVLPARIREGSEEPFTVPDAVLSIRIPLALHQLDVAVERAQRALRHFPASVEIASLAEEVETLWGEWQKKVKTAAESGFPDSDTHLAAGDFYQRVGNYQRARDYYRKAVEEEGLVPDEAWQVFAGREAGVESDTTLLNVEKN